MEVLKGQVTGDDELEAGAGNDCVTSNPYSGDAECWLDDDG